MGDIVKKHKPPHQQPRGPCATLPRIETPEPPPCGPNPYPEISSDPWWAHGNRMCACWHQYDECPCDLVAHVPAHPVAECEC